MKKYVINIITILLVVIMLSSYSNPTKVSVDDVVPIIVESQDDELIIISAELDRYLELKARLFESFHSMHHIVNTTPEPTDYTDELMDLDPLFRDPNYIYRESAYEDLYGTYQYAAGIHNEMISVTGDLEMEQLHLISNELLMMYADGIGYAHEAWNLEFWNYDEHWTKVNETFSLVVYKWIDYQEAVDNYIRGISNIPPDGKEV